MDLSYIHLYRIIHIQFSRSLTKKEDRFAYRAQIFYFYSIDNPFFSLAFNQLKVTSTRTQTLSLHILDQVLHKLFWVLFAKFYIDQTV